MRGCGAETQRTTVISDIEKKEAKIVYKTFQTAFEHGDSQCLCYIQLHNTKKPLK
jgi:hypothetical protein